MSVSKKKSKASTISYAIWLNGVVNEKEVNTPTPRDLTLSWLRFGYQGPVIESSSVDRILRQACDAGSDACFIQMPGSMISEDWMLPHWGRADFHVCLQQCIASADFLVSAGLVEVDGYYALDTQCLLINLHHYQALGCPDFACARRELQTLIKPQLSTITTAADRKQLQASDERIQIAPAASGWGFIEASLKNGLVVPELPKAISDKCISLVPSPSDEKTQNSSMQQRFLSNVNTQISRGKAGVFLWNIESYDDVCVKSLDGISAAEASSMPEIQNLYCVAAGFKPNMLLHRHGFDSNAKVTFFDYSQQALDIREVLLNEWDGSDYPDFCKQLMQRFPAQETFYQLWNGLQPHQIDWADVSRLWENELLRWGGAEKFQQLWQKQLKLNYDFVRCDIVNNPMPLLEKIPNLPGAVVWWSNAFFTISSNWLLSIEQRKQRFQFWIEHLATHCPQSYLYGANHNNTPVNNVTAIEYLATLKKQLVNTEYNELMLHRESALPLRF